MTDTKHHVDYVEWTGRERLAYVWRETYPYWLLSLVLIIFGVVGWVVGSLVIEGGLF